MLRRIQISNMILLSFLIVTVIMVVFSNGSMGISFKTVYAQSDNSSDLGIPFDNSNSLGVPLDNVTTLNYTGNTAGNTQTSSAVPEFGGTATMILVVAVISIVAISAKTKLRFD